MERSQKPLETKEQEHLLNANALKLGDQDEEYGAAEAEHIGASPPASSGPLAAEPLQTINSARSSRSDTMYDQTPPDFDVRIDKPQLAGISFRYFARS